MIKVAYTSPAVRSVTSKLTFSARRILQGPQLDGTIIGATVNTVLREPWNKGKLVGQKAPFKLKDIWALRVRL